MGEMMNAAVNPGLFEHVTKMGRIGVNTQSKNRPRAHFRPIPYQDSVLPQTPEIRSVASQSRVRTVIEPDIHVVHPPPHPEPSQPRAAFHYEEMRLGRNMRAAPRGFSSQMTDSNTAPDSDVSEPLLNLTATNQPSNVVVDYLASTHPASVRQSTTTTSAMFSARAITSPQHPSQHLIEMLNRNQHYSTQLRDLEQEQEDEREQLQQQQQQEEQQREEIAQHRREILEAQRRYEDDVRRQDKIVDIEPFTNGAGTNNDDMDKGGFGLLTGTLLTQTKEPSEQASTQPFSPKASTSFDFTGVAMATSSSSTRGQAISMERNEVTRQETSEDVNEI